MVTAAEARLLAAFARALSNRLKTIRGLENHLPDVSCRPELKH
jgi:hypothetical protein